MMSDTQEKSLHELVGAALKVARRDGRPGGENLRIAEHPATGFTVSLEGAGAPPEIQAEFAPPAMVRETRAWRGSHLLTVMAPLKVLQIAWNADEPFRIMSFSRGDWEAVLGTWARGGED